MKKAGILGFGLIGGSIALALKNRCNMEVFAFNRSEKPMADAYDKGVLSAYSTSDLGVFSDCDIIFLCTPVDKICTYAKALAPIIKKDCILTDAGSTKGEIYRSLAEIKDINYIGGHPMAGSEKTGFSAAKEDLYENAFYIISPAPHISPKLTESYKQLVSAIGALPFVLDPFKHDHIVAAISHVPHIIAAALVNTVSSLDDDGNMHELAAGGFKDITRIASSSWEMWTGICSENRHEILNVLNTFSENIEAFKTAVANHNTEEAAALFKSAKAYRDTFKTGRGRGHCKSFDFKVDISDRPGAIAEVAVILGNLNINIKNIGIINNRDYSEGVMKIVLESHSALEKAEAALKERGFHVIL